MCVAVHVVSFEGPDVYSSAGGLGTRVTSLAYALAAMGLETHLWFIGDPSQPGHAVEHGVHVHRWCQWVSRHHPGGAYDGEEAKRVEFAKSVPAAVASSIIPVVARGQHAAVLAEEWQTAEVAIEIDWLLRAAHLRDRVSILWNANNTFGFERIDWGRLARAATITTVSRYMKHLMVGVEPGTEIVPNGVSDEAFGAVPDGASAAFRQAVSDRTVIAKIARWDPDKRWSLAIDIIGELKRAGVRPLFVARGGKEPYGRDVLSAAAGAGLTVVDRALRSPGARGVIEALTGVERADVVNIVDHMDWESRRLVYRDSAAVLANSGHEPFGLVGLETMAAGGLACTGSSGEDYAVTGYNALVTQTADPHEFVELFAQLRGDPDEDSAVRDAGVATAHQYRWPAIVRRALMPRIELGRRSTAERRQSHVSIN